MKLFCQFVFLMVVGVCGQLVPAQDTVSNLPVGKRVLFLGDSITHAGDYVAVLETIARLEHPGQEFDFLNLGLPSETVSGLSEPGHAGGAFPRPDLHERLLRVLDQTKPDVVIACYGMNDGIYYPLSEDRFAKFKSGMERLHNEVESRGATIVHLTPAFFDALPIKDRLLPKGLDEYQQPYEGYDEVLTEFAKWLLGKRPDGWVVLDVHDAMKSAVVKRRQEEPKFTFAGDGVHPNFEGQLVIAAPLAVYWGLDLNGSLQDKKGKRLLDLVMKKQNIEKLAWLTATKHIRPGIPAGLSLEEAAREAAALKGEMDELTK